MLFESQLHEFKMALPWNAVKLEKEKQRGHLQQLIRVIPEEERRQMSADVCSLIEQLPEFQSAQVVMMYYPVHHEIDLRPLMEKYAVSKVILLPVTHRKSIELRQFTSLSTMTKDHMRVPVPDAPTYIGKQPDLILVPGIGFDERMVRLGHGGGYYDRFLRKQRTKKVGICYDCQYVKELPYWIHDQRVDKVVTPTRAIAR